jgi:hypothetical protein
MTALATKAVHGESLRPDAEPSYVIASLAGTEPDMRSFRIRSGEVGREEIEIVNQTAEVSHVL